MNATNGSLVGAGRITFSITGEQMLPTGAHSACFLTGWVAGDKGCARDNALKVRKRNTSAGLQAPKVYQTISYQTLCSQNGTDDAESTSAVAKNFPKVSEQIVPISNLPTWPLEERDDADAGVPSKRDFVIYRLRRQVAELRLREKQLLAKLAYCQDVIAGEKRFLENGLRYDQWETLGELQKRKHHLEQAVLAISDPNCTPKRLAVDESL